MSKYYYYIINPILRKIFLKIIIRKILRSLFLKIEPQFNVNKVKLHTRDFVLKTYFNLKNIKHPRNIYKHLYKNTNVIKTKNPYQFGGGADEELLYNLSKKKELVSILETGVANGWSSLSILLAIRKNKNKSLTSLDIPYPYKNSEKYIGNVIPSFLKKNQWKLIIGIDSDQLNLLNQNNQKFDLIHYDSDKNYFSKINSFNIIWNLLNTNGYLISDDVSDNNAFVDFAKQIKSEYIIYKYESKYIGIIKK